VSENTERTVDTRSHANGRAHAHAAPAHAPSAHAHTAPAHAARERNGRAARTSGPRISLIVPALNEEKLIERTLLAFPHELRARYHAELVVSDGGSHDRTVEIARHHADLVVQHTDARRQTIAEGRNRGAEVATGDLLVFINADTIPRDVEAFMRQLTAIAAEGTSARAAYACPVEVLPEERKLSDRLFHGFFNNYVRALNAVGIGMGRGECQVIRRDAFTRVGGYNNAMVAGEDFDLYSRLARGGSIGHHANLCVYESPRRFRRYGYLRVLATWSANALAVIFLRRSISQEWEEIR
jgi:glycosyltransferase involved in cell wall biosynthesis